MFDVAAYLIEFLKIDIVPYWIFAPAFLGLFLLVKELWD